MERNRIGVNAAALETSSLTRSFGEYTAVLYGIVHTRARIIPTGGLSYLDFMAPGILAQSVLFVAIFYGIAVIWERDLGIVHKFLASSTPRAALGLGKAHLSILEGLTGDANCFLEANFTATTAATSSRCAKLHGHRISRECFY